MTKRYPMWLGATLCTVGVALAFDNRPAAAIAAVVFGWLVILRAGEEHQ